MNKESFVFYKSFYEAIKNIPDSEQLKLYNAICEYSFTDTIPDLPEGIAKAMFILMKPNIDSANARYRASVENGKKGGRPKKEAQQKPNNNLDETQQKPNANLNDNVDDNDNEDVNVNVNDKKVKEVKHKYGEYQRIVLTDNEYEKLCDDFGKDFIDSQITLLDEYVEGNNNKNKYKNFNLVLRKSIREGWFKTTNQNFNHKQSGNPFFDLLREEGKLQ